MAKAKSVAEPKRKRGRPPGSKTKRRDPRDQLRREILDLGSRLIWLATQEW